MRVRHDWASECAGKHPHKTRTEAMRSLRKKSTLEQRIPGRRIMAYKCSFGNHWHIGSTAKKRIKEQ